MLNFDFYNPTHIVFGRDRLAELDKLVPENATVLVTFDSEYAKMFDTVDKVKAALKNRRVIEFGNIQANPKYESLIEAVEIAKTNQVDLLLAVGGGSVMDATKFIAMAATHTEREYSALLSHGFTPFSIDEALPLGCVVTLPATGSEMNMAGVVTLNGQKMAFMCPQVFPAFSFLDPELTLTLPKSQVANGVVDAYIHVIEQYLTYPVNAMVQDRIAEGIMKTLIEVGPVTYNDNSNVEARMNFIWSATNAQNGIIGVGVPHDWSTHIIGHELTSLFGIAHGRTLAIILPSLLRERKEQKREKLLQYAERVWGIETGTDDEKIDLVIDKTEHFFRSFDINTKLSEYDIDENGIEQIVGNLDRLGMTALSERGDLTLDIVKKILKAAM
ncbi:NADH-dependent alcohol dehydrogenase [Photobacterium rosenbergii]|uniref:NADH-dependent alcohol dehydrogenase n=1 Tax=Photobacterium rosenbergii TaxID=294936 RepID=A0A2T3NJT5_9GAMM|nr:iron-containing alcohol dehydrogenase [Photobacterium rosenbergii]PSW15776.1 NADH-dependent alcohol dehydrogenase [Photobacterium rosenbergii]